MKLPEKAPGNLQNLIEKLNKGIDGHNPFTFLFTQEGKTLAHKANKEYHYWDKVKYYKLPDNITPEIAWAAVKFSRPLSKQIVLKDTKGIHFQFWLPDIVLKELSFIDKHSGEQGPDLPEKQKEKYMVNSLMEEAIASSQLEGAATTREKAKEMLRSGKKPENIFEKMIRNNYLTMQNLKEFIKSPLSSEGIKRIQGMLTEDTLDNPKDSGRFRTEKDDIQVIDGRDGKLLFDPPHSNTIELSINELCEYANSCSDDEYTYPVLKAIIIHFWLAYIHPFVDGNGRTARALFYWYLLKCGYWKFEYLAISRIIKEAPAQYARAYLYTEMDDCDLTYFLIFNLGIIHRAIDKFEAYVERKKHELMSTVNYLRNFPDLNHRQYDLLRHAVLHPEAKYSIRAHQKLNGVVYQTARIDMLNLVKNKFLIKRRIGKEFYFFPSDDTLSKLKSLTPNEK
jgi:Fic family protein